MKLFQKEFNIGHFADIIASNNFEQLTLTNINWDISNSGVRCMIIGMVTILYFMKNIKQVIIMSYQVIKL